MGENAIARAGGFFVATGLRMFFRRPVGFGFPAAYIDGQEEHHKTRTFQEEFRMFLKKYGVEYDEAYVWD